MLKILIQLKSKFPNLRVLIMINGIKNSEDINSARNNTTEKNQQYYRGIQQYQGGNYQYNGGKQ